MHLAAESHVDRSIDSPMDFVKTNVLGTCTLLQAALEYWRGLSDERRESFRFQHISTDEVYGSLGEKGYFLETTPYAPRSPYSASKAAADLMALAFRRSFDLPVVITRCSNNYGPRQDPEKLIPFFISRLMEGKDLPLYGDAVSIGNLAAGSISVTNSLNARSAASFTAGALKGFGEIDLERVDVAGGTLDWLGGQLPAAKSETFVNLAEMSVGGGADADAAGTLSGGATRSWKAANDGFIQLQARCADPANTTLKLELLDAGGAVAAEVTPEGKLGNASAMRRFVWTVPVRKGDSLRLTMSAGELTLVKGQFIYFGVAE